MILRFSFTPHNELSRNFLLVCRFVRRISFINIHSMQSRLNFKWWFWWHNEYKLRFISCRSHQIFLWFSYFSENIFSTSETTKNRIFVDKSFNPLIKQNRMPSNVCLHILLKFYKLLFSNRFIVWVIWCKNFFDNLNKNEKLKEKVIDRAWTITSQWSLLFFLNFQNLWQ